MKPFALMSYLITALFLTGCASISTGIANYNAMINERMQETRANTYANVSDPHLVNGLTHFVIEGAKWSVQPAVAADGHQVEQFSEEYLIFKKKIAHEMDMEDIRTVMAEHPYRSNAENDALATAYVAAAKARGNTVAGYKPQATLALNKKFGPPFSNIEGNHAWYDRDVLLIEYDHAQQPVSFLIRAHQAQASIGLNVYMYTTVAFGEENMKALLFNTNRRLFENNFYRYF